MPRSAIRLMSAVAMLLQVPILTALGSPTGEVSRAFEIVEPEEIYNEPQPAPFPVHDDWKDWETWEASPDIVQSFPYYKMGYDLDGLAVYVYEFGKWDYRKLAEQPADKVEEFWKYFEQCMRHQQKDAGKNNGRVAQILDFDGFELSHHASKQAIKMAMKLFAAVLRLNSFVDYGYFVNVNFAAETFVMVARPFLSSYIDKFEIYGNQVDSWKPKIFKKIAADQLPPKLGGSNPNWKPVPLHR